MAKNTRRPAETDDTTETAVQGASAADATGADTPAPKKPRAPRKKAVAADAAPESTTDAPAEAPKKPRAPRKKAVAADAPTEAATPASDAAPTEEAPKKPRRTRAKAADTAEAPADAPAETSAPAAEAEAPARKPRATRKKATTADTSADAPASEPTAALSDASSDTPADAPVPRRRTRKTREAEPVASSDNIPTEMSEAPTQDAPSRDRNEARDDRRRDDGPRDEGRRDDRREDGDDRPRGARYAERPRGDGPDDRQGRYDDRQGDRQGDRPRGPRPDGRPGGQPDNRQGGQPNNQQGGPDDGRRYDDGGYEEGGGRRRNKRKRNKNKGGQGGPNGQPNQQGGQGGYGGGQQPQYQQNQQGGGYPGGQVQNNAPAEPFEGILELIGDKKFGFVRRFTTSLLKGDNDPFMPPPLIQKYRLRDGVQVKGMVRPGRKGAWQVVELTEVMGGPPEEWETVPDFDDGLVVYPDDKLQFVTEPSDVSMRVVDLVAPIGKGQRALIVAPPRAGKTILIKQIAAGLTQNHPEIKLVALLIDERPEEVTDFRRNTAATVFASSNDHGEDNHVRVATIAFEYSRRLVEQGHDVVILLDSLTRLGRTFNMFGSNLSGRTMSGGLDARALLIPRKIFGAARNIEDGGSLTIVATALVETGSRMDDVIFEEFKGTGNSEIVLDRELSEQRIYPAINIRRSGTRNEDRLVPMDLLRQRHMLLRALNSRHPVEAMQALTKQLQLSETNEELLRALIPE